MQMKCRVSALASAMLLLLLAQPLAAQPAQPPPPPPVADNSTVVTTYDDAFAALLDGDFAAASRGFAIVAQSSVVTETRAAASELLRLTHALQSRKVSFAAAHPTAAPVLAGPRDEDPYAGRTTVIATTTIASVYIGAVLIDLLDVDDFRAGVVTVLGATAVGFLGSLYGSRGRTITGAMGDAYSLGMVLGVTNGLLLASPFGLDSSEQVESFALATLAAGAATGIILADRTRPTQAQVSVTGTFSMMGFATAGLGLGVIQPDSLEADSFLLIMTAGLDAGAGVGMSVAPKLDWSLSRARMVGLGAFLGGLAGWGAAALVTGAEDPDDDTARLWSAATLAGMWGGLGLGAYFTRNMPVDSSFATAPAPARTVMVAPTMIRKAPGFAIGGAF